MNKIIFALMLCCVSCAAPLTTTQIDSQVRQELAVSPDIPPPDVRVVEVRLWDMYPRMVGKHWHGIIYVRPGLASWEQECAIRHEMIHYYGPDLTEEEVHRQSECEVWR